MALPPNKITGDPFYATEFNDLVAEVAGKVDPANASAAMVTATGSTTARSLAARSADVVWLDDFVTDFTGATDQSTNWFAAASLAMATGKILHVGPGTVRIDSQWRLPNDNSTYPKQRPLIIQGSGAYFMGIGSGSTPYGGTILDFRYAGTVAKIVTKGIGLLQMSGVTLVDLSGSASLPFLQTTNTTLAIKGNAFIGSKSGTACDQDAIVLGGTAATTDATLDNSPFQGYGTIIEGNYFNGIRRAVYSRVYGNGSIIRNNTIWRGSGSNLAGGGAIEIMGDVSNGSVGNVIEGNLIEGSNYPYPILLGDYSYQTSVILNNVYDVTATTLGIVRVAATSLYSLVIDGYHEDAKPGVSEASATPSTTHITAHQSQMSTFAQPVTILNELTARRNGAGSNVFKAINTVNNNEWGLYIDSTGLVAGLLVGLNPAGGGYENAMAVRRLDATQKQLAMLGSGNNFIDSEGADLILRANTGSNLWLGDKGGKNLYWQQSTKQLIISDATGSIFVGTTSGPSISSGTGVPAAAANEGSIYMRTGGTNGGFYVRENSAWVKK